VAGDPRAALLAVDVRTALTEGHALELRPWAEQEGAT
jgi:hypothetical protein